MGFLRGNWIFMGVRPGRGLIEEATDTMIAPPLENEDQRGISKG
jgi:hypothetical protein